MGCVYKSLVFLVKFTDWLVRRAIDALVVLVVLWFDQRATATVSAYKGAGALTVSTLTPTFAPTPAPTASCQGLDETQCFNLNWRCLFDKYDGCHARYPESTLSVDYYDNIDYDVSYDYYDGRHVTIFDLRHGPLSWPLAVQIGYSLYIVPVVFAWVFMVNLALDFFRRNLSKALSCMCCRSNNSEPSNRPAPAAGGPADQSADESGSKRQGCLRRLCPSRADGRVEEVGEFKSIPERAVQELEIPSADAIFGRVNELSAKLKSVNDEIVGLAEGLREKLGETGEEELMWKEWVAKKTQQMKENAMATMKEEMDWKGILPKIDLMKLATGELSVTMPADVGRKMGPIAGNFVDALSEFADSITELVTSNVPDLTDEVSNVVSEATNLDPSQMQDEVVAVVGSNPFKILGILSAIKQNTAITLGLKNSIESILHNIRALLNGMKDGMYKGLFSPAAPQKKDEVSPAAKQKKDEAAGVRIGNPVV